MIHSLTRELYVQVYEDGPLFAECYSQLSARQGARSLIAHHYGSNSRPHLRAARKTGNTPGADVLLRRLDQTLALEPALSSDR